MKNMKYSYKLLKELTNTKIFKAIFLFIILWFLFYFMSITIYNPGFAILEYFNSTVGILILFLVMTISAYSISIVFNKKISIVMRYETLKKYHKELNKYIVMGNFITYLIFWVLLFSFALLFCGNNFGYYQVYNIPIIFYLVFVFLKLFLLVNAFIMIGLCLENMFGNYIGATFILLINGINYMMPIKTHLGIVEGFKFDYSYYFYSLPYKNFFTEFIYSLLMIVLIYVVYGLINILCTKHLKREKTFKN